MESIETEICEDRGKRDEKGRRVLGDQAWERVLAEYEGCGLTQKAFCRREGVNYNTFVARLGRLRRGNVRKEAKVAFFEGEWMAQPGHGAAQLEVVLADGQVLRGSDPVALARLARELKG